jgi:hypothetical protein
MASYRMRASEIRGRFARYPLPGSLNSAAPFRRVPLKPFAKWVAIIALVGLFGCTKGGKDLNKNLKPVDTNAPKPQAIKDASKAEGGQALK